MSAILKLSKKDLASCFFHGFGDASVLNYLIFNIKHVNIVESGKKYFRKGKPMANQEKLLEEIFELALQNDMNYFG